jgi:NAD-dependent dihydropyrimidine dehydrogenase PreA subunit
LQAFSASSTMAPSKEWTASDIDEILDELRPITIPVNVSVDGRQKVMGFKEAERLLRKARLISLEECSCRKRIGGCNSPLDVCLCMDKEAEEAMERRGAWEINLAEAMDALRRSHEAGLVHMAYETRGGPINIICSCCACCCHTLAAITRFGYDESIIEHSDVIAERDTELCDSCGVCVGRCHFGAWTTQEEAIAFSPDRCAGCGVCASSCPSGAIRLVKRG